MKIKIEHVVIISTVFSIIALAGCGSDKEKIEVSYVDEDKFAEGDGNAMMDVEVLPKPPVNLQLAGEKVAFEAFDEDEMIAVRSHYSPEEQKEFVASPPVEVSFNEKVQNALKHAGYYDGPLDGVIGDAARTAIKNFQKAHHLTSDGVVGKRTWSKLSRYYYEAEE